MIILIDIHTSFFEENYLNKINGQNFSDLLMKIDRKTWLVDEDLLRADKMGMANGLEVRVPLLDKNLVEFSENIPFSQKINLSNAKIILKQAFSGRIPDYLFKTAQKRLVFSWRKMAQKAGGAFKSQRSIIAELLQTDKRNV